MSDLIANTPYDDVYRTMFCCCHELIYPLINEVFGEHYTGKEKLIQRQNEHFDLHQDGSEDKRITDSVVDIIGDKVKKYHCECQSEADNTIAIRMFQYGSEIAIEEAELTDDGLNVEMPNAAVIFLRCNDNTSDRLMIHVKSPDGAEISYPIHVLKIKDYTIDELFEKELYILIPFYLFNLEKDFALYDSDERKRWDLFNHFIKMRTRLERLAEDGRLKTFNQCMVRDMSNKVAQNLTRKYEIIRKGIGDIMGGKVIELEITQIRDQSLKQGMENGIEQGIEQGQNKLVEAVERLRNGESKETIIQSGIDEHTFELAMSIK